MRGKGRTDDPRQGEIWTVRFDPTVGSELQKTRPALVVNADFVGRLPLRIVVPMTSLGGRVVHNSLLIPVASSSKNGLAQDSYADVFQIKSVSTMRFLQRLGHIDVPVMQEVMEGIALCLGWYDGLH